MNDNIFTFNCEGGQVLRVWDYDEEGIPVVITTAFVKMWDHANCIPMSEVTNCPIDESDSLAWCIKTRRCWEQADADRFYEEMKDRINCQRESAIDENRSN